MMGREALGALDSLLCGLSLAPKDWSLDKYDAWVYGIIAGWDDESLIELQSRFRWKPETVEKLKSFHKAFGDLKDCLELQDELSAEGKI